MAKKKATNEAPAAKAPAVKKAANPKGDAGPFPSDDFDTLVAWAEGKADIWAMLHALAHVLLWLGQSVTPSQKAACKKAMKGAQPETLDRKALAARLKEAKADAEAGKVDWATLFALVMKLISLIPFSA